MSGYYVYILASERNGILYIGMTSGLPKRTWEHKNEVIDGFTKKYDIKILVYYEVYDDVNEAIKREKRLKRWDRKWKLELIEKNNPQWKDMYDQICA